MPVAAKAVVALAGLILLVLLPVFQPAAFVESILYLIFFWITLATSWTIFCGFSGYFSFGHGAFFGAGMYTTANLAAKFGVPFLWTLPLAGIVAMALGVAIGVVVFRVRRLRGEIFALLTLAVGFMLATVVRNTPIDGGRGVLVPEAAIPVIYGSPSTSIYILALALAVASVGIAWSVQRSALGRGLFAIKDDEDVAEVMGIPTFRYKLVALALSCFLAGVAGGLHSAFVSYVTVEETFSFTVPLFVILMSLIGGPQHWMGPAIGATFITLLNYSFVSGEWALAGRAIIGLTLVLAILFLPLGVMGLMEAKRRRQILRAPAVPTDADPSLPAAARLIGPTFVSDGRERLRCEDIRLSFRGVKALDGVSLDVRAGEILGIVGPNGSGKSTLVNVISGFYRPDSGRILIAGRDIAKMPAHLIARTGIARTYQIPRPFPKLSVLENVALPAMFGYAALSSASAAREALAQLAFVGLGGRQFALPTAINLHQRKFLEFARALAAQPKLILLDEVLAGLTPAEIESAIALIRQIRENGTTIVFIEHNMQAVLKLADRLVVLNYGRVIAVGRPHEVVKQHEVMSAYLGTADA